VEPGWTIFLSEVIRRSLGSRHNREATVVSPAGSSTEDGFEVTRSTEVGGTMLLGPDFFPNDE
jgi:hypothetical protein